MVGNSALLEALLQALDACPFPIKWALSPSHQGILGNEPAYLGLNSAPNKEPPTDRMGLLSL